MSINIYSINNLLKVTLIFGIALSVFKSVPVNAVGKSKCDTDKKENIVNDSKTSEQLTANQGDQKPATEKELNKLKNDLNECFEEKINYSKKEINDSLNDIKKKVNKSLSENDSLIFVDLPIAVILLLLWFLSQKKQQQQIDKLTNNQNRISSNFNQFNEINNKLNNLDRKNHQIIEKIQDNNQKNIDSEVRLRELLSKQQFNQSANYHNSSTPDISNLNSIAIVDKVSQLVENYNQNKNSISDKAKAMVTETQVSLNQRRSGNSNTVTLENTTQKKYWILEENNDYYLIPHAQIKFDEFNITTLESLFDCTNFTPEYSDFKLVKLAKVSQLSSETWQLETKGKLEFS